MKTLKPNRILSYECLETLRREVRKQQRDGRILSALVLIVCLVALYVVMPPEWREAVIEWWRDQCAAMHAATPKPMMRAGFGVPEWVAFGIVGTVVLLLMGKLAWGVIVEGDEADTLAMPPEHDPLSGDEAADALWMQHLKAFFARRGVTLSSEQCLEMRGICVPNHKLALVWLDGWMRKHLRLRLFLTTLMEVQAICLGKGVAA